MAIKNNKSFLPLLSLLFLVGAVSVGVALASGKNAVFTLPKAAYPTCPSGEQCPVAGYTDHLRSCAKVEVDGSPDEMLCNAVGRVGMCGTRQYCCPKVGASWTTDMSACDTKPKTTKNPGCTAHPEKCKSTEQCVNNVCKLRK